MNKKTCKNVADEDNGEESLEEVLEPRKNLPPLLSKLNERTAERLHYLGVSFGLTSDLLRFWKRSSFVPVYLRQSANDLTGEHSCIMLRTLNDPESSEDSAWLSLYWKDFQRRVVSLLSYQFKSYPAALGLNLLQTKAFVQPQHKALLEKAELDFVLTAYDVKRLELYSKNMVDYHLIMDLLPEVAKLYFLGKMEFSLSAVQTAILLGMGLQRKSVDVLAVELELPGTQILGLFNRTMRKVTQFLNGIVEREIESTLAPSRVVEMEPTRQSLQQEMEEVEAEFKGQQSKKELEALKHINLEEFAIAGSKEDWDEAIGKTKSLTNISVQSTKSKHEKRKSAVIDEEPDQKSKKPKKSKKKKT